MSKKKTALGPLSIAAVLRESRKGSNDRRPLSVVGARELVPVLARALREGGDASAVVENQTTGVAGIVWVGRPDEAELRAASRTQTPMIAVTDATTLPYIRETDLVRVEPGQGFPVDRIVAALAARLGDPAISLAARLPVLRGAVCDHLIDAASRQNGLIAAAVFVPGVDMPILTLNEARLVLRLARAHGMPLNNARVPELLGVAGVGFGLRTAARELLDAVPVAGWLVKGAIAYSGTKAIGEAAQRHFAARV